MKINQTFTIDLRYESYNLNIKGYTTDINSRYIDIKILDKDEAVDLTNHSIKVYAVKPDGTKIFNNCEIVDAVNGLAKLQITSQMMAVPGTFQGQFIIYGNDGSKLSTQKFNIIVEKSFEDVAAIESSNEFGALQEALQKVESVSLDITPITNKIGDTSKITESNLVDAVINDRASTLTLSRRVNPSLGLSLLGSMLDGRESQVINVLGDSTGNETTEWVYLLGQKISSTFPNYNVRYYLFNNTTGLYDSVINIKDDGNPRNYRFAGTTGTNIPQLDKEQVPLTSTDLDVRIKLSLDHWAEGVNKTLISRCGNANGTKSWRLGINTGNFLLLHWSEDGSNDKTAGYTVSTSQFADGSTVWLRFTLDVDNGSGGNVVSFYKSTDGLTWTQLGSSIVSNTATTTVYSPPSQKYEIGGYNSYSELFAGNVYEVQIMDGIDNVNVAPRSIDAWKQPTTSTPAAVLQGTPEVLIFNGSIPGYGNSNFADPVLLRKVIVNAVCPIMFISLSHNDLNRQGYELISTWDTLISRIRSYSLYPMIALLTQNPRILPAQWIREQGIRRRMLIGYALKNNLAIIDTYLAFLQCGQPLTTLINNTDGIHPNGSGELVIVNTVWGYLNLL